MNSLSEHVALSELIKIHSIYAFLEELAKRAYRAKRVHLVRMNTYILLLRYLWLSEAESLSPGNLVRFFVESRTLSRAYLG